MNIHQCLGPKKKVIEAREYLGARNLRAANTPYDTLFRRCFVPVSCPSIIDSCI